jgi:hypothetical protein
MASRESQHNFPRDFQRLRLQQLWTIHQHLAAQRQPWFVVGVCHNAAMCGRYRLSRRKQIIAEDFTAK